MLRACIRSKRMAGLAITCGASLSKMPGSGGANSFSNRRLPDGRVCFVSCADERRGFVEHHRNRHIEEHLFEVPFVLEGVEERAVLHFWQDLDGNATGDVDTAEGQYFQCQVAGLRSVYIGPEVERLHTDRARVIETALGNEG